MYSITTHFMNRGKLLDKMELLDISGIYMASKNKTFTIKGTDIQKIQIMDRVLANPIASKKVFQKYNKLIALLTELLTDDDDSGSSYREALDQIEKFRLEVKNKYRDFLTKKEIEKMSKELSILQKEAKKKYMELSYSYEEYQNNNKRSR